MLLSKIKEFELSFVGIEIEELRFHTTMLKRMETKQTPTPKNDKTTSFFWS